MVSFSSSVLDVHIHEISKNASRQDPVNRAVLVDFELVDKIQKENN